MFPRTREITDAMGARLRVGIEARPSGALVTLERPDQYGRPCARLDGYGAELLWGYIMAARLALPNDLPDESIGGGFPSRLRLRRDPSVAIVITQADLERPFAIPATFWDRLYAELCLVTAHARDLARQADALVTQAVCE